MLAAVISLTAIGLILGLVLGIADRIFKVESNPLVDSVLSLLPGTNCGQCGFPGCSGAAVALAEGRAPVTCCPGGGKGMIQALAAKLGVSLDLSSVEDEGPKVALKKQFVSVAADASAIAQLTQCSAPPSKSTWCCARPARAAAIAWIDARPELYGSNRFLSPCSNGYGRNRWLPDHSARAARRNSYGIRRSTAQNAQMGRASG